MITIKDSGRTDGTLIEEIKCGISKGGYACGPVPGCVVVSIRFSKGGKSMWISNSEFEGFPGFFLSDSDMHDRLINDDCADDEALFAAHIDELDGFNLTEYRSLIQGMRSRPESEYGALLMLTAVLTVCDWDTYEDLIDKLVGKYAEDVEYPDGIFEGCDEDTEYDDECIPTR